VFRGEYTRIESEFEIGHEPAQGSDSFLGTKRSIHFEDGTMQCRWCREMMIMQAEGALGRLRGAMWSGSRRGPPYRPRARVTKKRACGRGLWYAGGYVDGTKKCEHVAKEIIYTDSRVHGGINPWLGLGGRWIWWICRHYV
jgi:hypothetical protein